MARLTYSFILTFLIITRFISEVITNFIWNKANYAWSSLALIAIPFLTFLYLLSLKINEEKNIFIKYSPVFVYLVYLLLRVNFYDIYSLKCFLSEFIVWWVFIFTAENTFRDPNARRSVELWIIRLIKAVVLIGMVQILIFSLSKGIYTPLELLSFRPVTGIFAHENIFLIVTLPFTFYFVKKHQYHWVPFILLSCLFTGTRAPFLGLICMSNIILKTVLRKKIVWKDIIFSLAVIGLAYSLLIGNITPGTTDFSYEKSRLGIGSLQWRVDFWQNFIKVQYDLPTFFGNGVGSADKFGGDLINKPLIYPHSDFIRIFYDTGVIGLIFFLNLIFFMLRMVNRMISTDSDFIMISYMLIVCFYITDNFIYNTHSIFIYMFIAIFLRGGQNTVALSECLVERPA